MKKRRTLAVVLAAAMTAGMLVGCTGGGKNRAVGGSHS